MNPLVIIIIILVFYLLFKQNGMKNSDIEQIVQENYFFILNLAEEQGIIKSYIDLDIEEGGHYPKFYNEKHIDIVKSAIRLYLSKNKDYKLTNKIQLFNDYQKQEILKNCSQELKNTYVKFSP